MENRENIGEELTNRIINEKFETKKEKISYLKNISNSLKYDKELRSQVEKEIKASNNVKESFHKTKTLFNKKYNGFSSILFLSAVTFLFSSGCLFYLLLTIGYFK